MAFYLKYRPQTLSELIGQAAVKAALLGAQESNKISHAYLLVGPRGTGKTSTARILAKMVNCENQAMQQSSNIAMQKKETTGENAASLHSSIANNPEVPCNKCATCISITDGSNLDLIEIDAASNRGIDDIRTLRENVKLSPSSCPKKVYIIDEVHMLTTEAFNALLKTLEEPPQHCLFILATTEVTKVPPTILSRVQRLDFKMASALEMMEALNVVVKAEKIKIEEEALRLLAKKADGSFRDGVKLLDQLASSGEEITTQKIQEILKASDFEGISNLLQNLAQKDTTATLKELNSQLESGIQVKDLIYNLMDTMRALIFIKNNLGALVKEDFGTNKYQTLMELANNYSIQDLIRNLDILQSVSEKLRAASIPSLPLELAVVEICSVGLHLPGEVTDVTAPSHLGGDTKASKHLQGEVTEVPPARHLGGGVEPAKETVILGIPHRTVRETPESVKEDSGPDFVETTSGKQARITESTPPDVLKLQEKWTFVLETIKPYNYSLEALLRSVKIADCDQGVVLLEVPYSFHQRILDAPKSKDLLESVLSDVLGKAVKVSTVLGQRPQRVEDIANVEIAADDEIISLASEIFNGKLVD